MKFILFAAALSSFSSFAVENCKDINDMSPYRGAVTNESEIISYGGCPDNLLLNDRFVVRLSQVMGGPTEQKCLYSSINLSLICDAK